MADPVKVPVSVAVTLKVTIVSGPACRTLVIWKQGEKVPLAGSGLPASALGNINPAPIIASAQRLLRRCDRRRFRLNQQLVFIQSIKGTGSQSSGVFLEVSDGRSSSWHVGRLAEPVLKLVEEAKYNQQSRHAVTRDGCCELRLLLGRL